MQASSHLESLLACSLTYLSPFLHETQSLSLLNSVLLTVCSVVTFCRMNVLVTNFGIPCRRAIRNILFSPHPEFLNLICWVCDNYSKILENFYFLHFAIIFFKLRGHKLMAATSVIVPTSYSSKSTTCPTRRPACSRTPRRSSKSSRTIYLRRTSGTRHRVLTSSSTPSAPPGMSR